MARITRILLSTAAGALILGLAPAPAAAQGIPVYDVSTYLQTLSTVQNTLQMIQQGAQVIQTTQKTLNSLQELTNVNAIASSLASTAERNILPGGTINMNALVTGNTASLGALGTQAQAIQSNLTVAPSGNSTVDQQYNQLLQQSAAPAATQLALGTSMLSTFQQRTRDLQTLQNSLSTATDPKQTMDLQARIAAEQAQLQNDMLKIEAIKLSKQAQDGLNNGQTAASRGAAVAATYQTNMGGQ